MSYQLNSEQRKSVLALDAQSRSIHCVGRVTDWEEVWALKDKDGWLFLKPSDELEYFPIWPHREYAQVVGKSIYDEESAESLTLDDFMENWLPGMKDDGIKIGVFPDTEGNMWIMEPEDLRADLLDEIAKYE